MSKLSIWVLFSVCLLSGQIRSGDEGVAYSKSVWRKVDVGIGIAQINGVAMTPNGQHIVLSSGANLHSGDRGVTWETIASVSEILNFGDDYYIFNVGSNAGCCSQSNCLAGLSWSTDYGNTWNSSPVRTPICFNDVFFLDSLHGWAVGSWKDSIVITKNGGKTLFTRPYGFGYDISGNPRFGAVGVNFLDTLNGYAAGFLPGTDSAVLRTTDGGNTWTVLPTGITSSFSAGYVHFTDSIHGWLFGIGTGLDGRRVFWSSDGGQTWTERPYPPNQDLQKIKAVDSLNCWMIGDAPFPHGPRVWRTSDAGESWVTEYNGPGGLLLDLDMADTAHGVAVGDLGTVLICAPLILGDLNADEELSAADVVLELNKVFLNQSYPALEPAGDVNCDTRFSPADVGLLVLWVFAGVPLPCTD